jgi:hypothetical protein
MDDHLNTWLNVATVLVLAGAIFYASLIPFFGGGDE